MNTNPMVQEGFRKRFMSTLDKYREEGLQSYHDVHEPCQEIQAKECLTSLSRTTAHLTITSRIRLFADIQTNAPEYSTYWLYCALGGSETTGTEKESILQALNCECKSQTQCTLEDCLCPRDQDFLKGLTIKIETHDSRERLKA